jgi:hypothetical protein
MLRNILMGTAAGAVGTVALDVVTYLDMAIRGRPSSSVPAQTVQRIAVGAGISLAPSGPSTPQEVQQHYQQIEARQSAIGALLGYHVGLGVGALYGAIRPFLGSVPLPLGALVLGAAATMAADVPAIVTGVTNPKEWGASGWLADVVPHLAYGVFTAVAYEAFSGGPLGRRSGSRAEYLAASARHVASRTRLG